MPFPETKRVQYENSPLVEVLCQFRYPPILKIDTEIPGNFQELIRKDFPLFSEKLEIAYQLPNQLFGAQKNTSKNYEFLDEHGKYKVNLTRTFISLSTRNYTDWDKFYSTLKPIVDGLSDIYSIPRFTRVGLRYVNLISRENLGLQGVQWKDLIEPHFIGFLNSSISENIDTFENTAEVILEDKVSKARIIAGLALKNGDVNEKSFLIDTDFFYSKPLNRAEGFDKLNFLHERAGRLIQWAIKEKLHTALKPK